MSRRIRTVKPEWLDDERLVLASLEARVMSIALLTLADDEGRGRGNPVILGAQVFPGSANPREASTKALRELAEASYVVLYEVDGQSYFQIRNFAKHQKIDRPRPSALPEPPEIAAEQKRVIPATLTTFDEPSTTPRRAIDDASTTEGNGREGNGRDQDNTSESEPPPSGPGKPDPVRLVFDAWLEEHVDPKQRAKCKLNGKRRRLIQARLREYPPERLVAAVQGIKRSPWHMGDNPDGKRWTGLEVILRDGTQVEKFEALLDGSAPVPLRRGRSPVDAAPAERFTPTSSEDLDAMLEAWG